MPRMNLDDIEVALIEAHRKKNLEANAFNAGLLRAREIFQTWTVGIEFADGHAEQIFLNALASEAKSLR